MHPLVEQLNFTRSEFRRGLEGLQEEEARRRILPMNCISWNVGHLANHEQRCLYLIQGKIVRPELQEQFGYGAPASTPALSEVLAAWETVTQANDEWLQTATTETLQQPLVRKGQVTPYLHGTMIQRVIYHYWYHTGENLAIRQQLGHTELPEFVGDLDAAAPFRV